MSRETPRSALSCRSDGIAVAHAELLDQVEHLLARVRSASSPSALPAAVIGPADYSRLVRNWSMPLRFGAAVRYRSVLWPRSCSTTSRKAFSAGERRRRRRRVARDRERRVPRPRRAVGVRQVHAAPHDRRPRGRDRAARSSIGDRDVTDLPPRARDIAMVFQTYALYPHMTVRENLGYGLKVRKTHEGARSHAASSEVAEMLGLEKLLDRRPAALSGGQRQRVAMGRAIVREPKAFLMDEPLSNLDAKLRVSMRAQLAALHARLGTTTIYVTHDQVEAMTLGHRVAVMRDGRILQVDTPQALYAGADQPLRRRLHRLARDEPRRGERRGRHGRVRRLPHPAAQPASDGEPSRVIVGIRPEAFEDASLADPSLPQIEVRGATSSRISAPTRIVIFQVDAPPVDVSEVREAAGDEDALLQVDKARLHRTRRSADVRARRAARSRCPSIRARFHFFDLATGPADRACGVACAGFRLAPLALALAAPASAAPPLHRLVGAT